MLVNEIRQKLKEARITRNKLHISAYTTLLGDILVIGKNKGNRDTTDEESIAVIKKFIKNLNDTNKSIMDSQDQALVKSSTQKEKYENNLSEIKLLEDLLPQQLAEENLKNILVHLVENSSAPVRKQDYMQFLKQNYAGRFDGALASKVFDSSNTFFVS